MSARYAGLCVGGPRDGEYFVGERVRVLLFKPSLEFSPTKSADDLKVEAAPTGAYVWSGTNFWQWEPAE